MRLGEVRPEPPSAPGVPRRIAPEPPLAAEPSRAWPQQSAILDRRISRREILRGIGLGALSGVIAACGSTVVSPSALSPTAGGATAVTSGPVTVGPPATEPATGPQAPPSPPTASPASAGAAPSAAATPGATAKPRGGTIRVGAFASGLTEGWLTWHAFGQEFAWNWCAQRLLSVAPDGTIVYDLASRHAVSADGREYTFTLAEGATWHDGVPVTAADVAFTYNTALKARAGSTTVSLVRPIKGSQAVIDDNSKDAEGIVVLDHHTIRFVLDQANAAILPTTFGVMFITPKHPFHGVALEDYTRQDIATNLFVGSGPLRMVEFRVKESVKLEARPNYVNGSGWKGLPGADRVSIRIYEDDKAQLTSTEAGDVDFQYFRTPSGDTLRALQAIEGMSTQKSLVGFNVFYSFFLGDGEEEPPNPVVKKKEFRQATIWALDLPTLVDDVLDGVYRVPDIFNQWIAPWANSDGLVRYTPQDIEKAKDLLSKSGYAGETIVCGTFGRDPDVPVIFQMWKDIGINTRQYVIEDTTYVDQFYTHPRGDILFSYGFGTLDGAPWGSDIFLGSRSFPQDGGYNAFRFANEEWDREYAAALAAPDEASQAPHLRRCSEIFNDELPYVPRYQRVDYALVGTALRGPERSTNLHPAVGGVRYWEWYIHG